MNLSAINQEKIRRVVEVLQKSQSILFITGAGISAESGLPTYRGVGGLYEGQATEDGIPIEMALAGDTLRTRPEITWKYLSQIEENCRKATCNRAHEIIALIERRFPRVWVLTQNIDGFHGDAGSKNVIEIHGNYHHLLCTDCSWKTTVEDYSGFKIPPSCPKCKGLVRPAVVFFGEMLPEKELDVYMDQCVQGFDVYVWIGTTSVFPYIQRPIVDAKKPGRFSVEINPAETEISNVVDVKLAMRATTALENIWQEFQRIA